MNLPYSFPSNKLGSIDSALSDAPLDGKSKSFPTQAYGVSSSSSSHTQGYNERSPSPPLSARVYAVNSNMNANLNGSFAAPSPLSISHFPSQNHQQQGQVQRQHQHSGHNGSISNVQMHTQIMQPDLPQSQLSHQHQNRQNNEINENSQINPSRQQHHNPNQNDSRNLHGFSQYGQQKVTPQQSYDFHEPGFENNHFQENNSATQSHEQVNGSKPLHSYNSNDVSVQDPQLRHLHHSPHHPQAQQSHMHLQQHRQIQHDQPVPSAVHDPRLQGQVSREHGHVDPGLQASDLASQLGQPPNIALQLSHSQLTSESVSGLETSSKMGNSALDLISKMSSRADDDGLKKKRGRPKKLILDPSTNSYIDSSHENFKKLNKLLKQNTDGSIKQASPMENGLKFDSLNDQEMKQLLESKDRRGRPRKFPIEQTGITIKGVRVSGSMKARKKQVPTTSDASNKVEKKKRGRPRTVL